MNDLPPGWARTTIGAIATLINGRAFKPSEWSSDGFPIIRIQNLNRPEAPYNSYSGPVAERHIVETGDLLFAWSGTPGTSFGAHIWRGSTAILNQHIFNVRTDPDQIDLEFLGYAINQTLGEQVAKAHGGAGLRHVTKKAFAETEITLPPVAEQKRITERLKLLENRIGLARSHLMAAISAADRAKSSLLRAAYDLTILPLELRQAYLSEPHVSVRDVVTEMSYGTSAKSSRAGEVPVLRMGNIQFGELDWSELVFTSDPDEIRRYGLIDGDVLFNRTNSPELVGKTAVYRGERPAIYAGYLIRVRCSDRMLPDYLAYCLNSPVGREYCRLVKSDGVSQSNINSRKLAAFRLPCPTREDQERIVNSVRAGLTQSTNMTKHIEKAGIVLNNLYDRIVSSALSGRMDTGDNNDEPASLQLAMLLKAVDRKRDRIIPTGTSKMAMNVLEILDETQDWISAQDLAERYGIRFGAAPEEIEPFFSELRDLDQNGRLLIETVLDDAGLKISERLRLREKS